MIARTKYFHKCHSIADNITEHDDKILIYIYKKINIKTIL